MVAFGDFSSLCRNVPSLAWCNLFYRQLESTDPGLLIPPATAGLGINPACQIPLLVSSEKHFGNIANVVVCALAFIVTLGLVGMAWRRRAAVARIEMLYFLALYALSLVLQLVSTSAFLRQGTTALVAITALHAGVVAALFATLLGNGLISMQVVEDGTLSSLIPFTFFTLAFFAATTYISFDVALHITNTFGPSNPPQALHSTPLFVLLLIWPGAAALLYFVIMTYVIVGMLREVRPLWHFVLAGVLFILSQLDFFLLSKVICNGTKSKIDGSFVATILETLCVIVLFSAWKSITEDTWEEDAYGY